MSSQQSYKLTGLPEYSLPTASRPGSVQIRGCVYQTFNVRSHLKCDTRFVAQLLPFFLCESHLRLGQSNSVVQFIVRVCLKCLRNVFKHCTHLLVFAYGYIVNNQVYSIPREVFDNDIPSLSLSLSIPIYSRHGRSNGGCFRGSSECRRPTIK